MLNKASITWSIKQIVKMIKNGNIVFDNAVQRGYEWDVKRSSLFIHSLIVGYPVPPVFAARGENKVYDMLDGKQRMTTLLRFYNGEFALKDIPPITYNIDGQEMEMYIDDSKYENLPEEVRDELDSTTLNVYYFDGITEDEVAEMFRRLNNGKPVSSSVLMRVQAKSKDKLKEIGQHPLFQKALTKKALEAYTNEELAIRALYILNGGDNLETKNLKKWITETEISNAMAAEVGVCLSRIQKAVEVLEKDNKKVAKKLVTKVHLISLLPIINRSREDKIKDADLAAFLKAFYGSENKTSVSNSYNEACDTGTNKKEATTTRINELEKFYNKMFHKGK